MNLLTGTRIIKRFGSLEVLRGVDISIRKGEALGLVGPNGAGKTTLFGVLAGTLPATEGLVHFNGSDITASPAETRCRQGIARTHQVPRPFLNMSVLENTLVAAQHGASLRGSTALQKAQEALDRVGIGALATRPASTLGLLDRKRLELARTLATSPQILLLDEIGGGLTESELLQLVDLIGTLRSDGITIVWIEHVLHALLRVIDRLICMDSGVVLAEGSPVEVMADPRVMSAYLGSVPA